MKNKQVVIVGHAQAHHKFMESCLEINFWALNGNFTREKHLTLIPCAGPVEKNLY